MSLKGKTFNDYKVLWNFDRGRIMPDDDMWVIQCLSCKNIKVVSTRDIINNSVPMCTHMDMGLECSMAREDR